MYEEKFRELDTYLTYDETEILREMFEKRLDECVGIGETLTVETLKEKLIGE